MIWEKLLDKLDPRHRTGPAVALVRAVVADPIRRPAVAPLLADALEEAGRDDADGLLTDLRAGGGGADEIVDGVPARLVGSDWANAFRYAGEEPDSYGDGQPSVKACPPGSGVPLDHFTRRDVSEVYAADEGENDERNWVCYGLLRDGRYFFLTAGCDYTGWG